MTMSANLDRWHASGETIVAGEHEIFAVDAGPRDAPAVMILHGFPGSSYDWHEVVALLEDRLRVIVFDMLGYGFSSKPLDARYSLFEQADLAEAVARSLEVDRCVLVAHDMGDTVCAELLMRSTEGKLGFAIDRAILTNGSIFMDLVQLSAGQLAILSLPDEVLPEPIPLDGFRPALAATFAEDAQPPEDVLDDMIALIAHDEGSRLLPRQIRYIEERRANQDRWTEALVSFAGPLTAAWGELDPIAVVAMTARLRELRPDTEVIRWPRVAHWPSIEVPGELAELIAQRALS